MEVRHIKPEEMISKSKVQTLSFLFSRDFSKPQDSPDIFQTDHDSGRAAFNDAGKMCSCLDVTF